MSLVGLLAVPAPAAANSGTAADRAARAVDRAEAVLENATAHARTAARAAYAEIADDYRRAQDRHAAARDQVAEIAQASYMGSSFSRINMLVQATGPADMIDRLGLVDQLMRTQQQEVDRLLDARRVVRTAQDRAGLAKREAEEAEAVAHGKLLAAKSAQAAAARARQALIRLVASRHSALRAANAQRAAVLAGYRAAVAEERRIRAALRGWAIRSGGGRYSGGKLYMPVNGWKTSDFGHRYDPYYRVWQLHAGTDFAAGGGTPIRAAASGRVIRAGSYGGYGRYTCIDHGRIGGRDLQTCYGHQSAILVHVGEYVRRGEMIGRVGTTGASTGNHLHFETRFDGVPRDPRAYLPHCLC